ncbi:phage minor structural protein [Bacillus thuringiensis]|uniref:phage tail spike protein n=1 Tax=Bacillus thuringiensis TaxID=1428 RepID=UPI0018CCC33A|nr:phage tail spike protein [Bacillus thuringiensis]MBG9532721.1 phage minor structural protein [Bacillus thuringiensis]
MRTPSGTLHVVDFKTNQIVSNIQTKDYWDDKRHWEIKNNIDTLEFKVFDNTEHAATLMQQNLVLKEVRDGRIVPYVITETEKDSNDISVIAYASGEWIQLAKAGIITPQKVEGKTVNEFIDMALVGTKWKRGRTEYAGFHTMTIDEFISPLKLLKDIASLFELEIQYRAEVVGSQIVSRYVDMVKKRGQETGKEVTLGKDLVGIKRVENSQNICTALLGFSKKEGEGFITITDINDGIPYLVDSDAFQRWNERGQHKFGFYTPETEGDITPKRLMTLMKTELAKRINSSISYDVQAQSIGRVFGLAHELINEGDTIRIKDTGFTPKLYLEARAIAGDESFTDPSQDKYVFGDYREITDPNEEMRKLYNRVLASLGNKANKELLEQLEKLAEEAKGTAEQAQRESESAKKLAEKVQENLKNNTVNIIEAKNPPTDNLIVGKTLWRDISNGKPGILKVWNGKDWELLIPDVEAIKKDTLEQVTKEINASAEKLDARVKEAETKADNLQKDFDAVKGEQERVSQVTKTLEESDKGTKETIKSLQGTQESMSRTIVETSKGVEGLKNTVSDIKKDQSGITDRVVKTEQNINGISSSIEQINKTSSQTIQKLNQVEQDANGTKQTIERIEKNVNNLDGDVINLVRGTKTLTTNEELSLKGGRLSVIKDTYNGNAIAQTDTEWQGIAVKPSELIKRGKIKIGDTVTFSVTARMIGGESTQVFFPNSTGRTTVNGEWKRVSVTIPVGSDATDPNVVYRFEAESIPKGALYQQTSPMLSLTKKVYPWRPAPEDQADSNEFIKVTTEIKTEAGKISTKLEQVEARTVGVENWLIHTGPNEKPQTIGMSGGAQVNKAGQAFSEDYIIVECTDHTDSFYQFHLDNAKMGDFEKAKDMTFSIDMQNDVPIDLIVFQFINGVWTENLYNRFPVANWSRRSFTFKIDARATGWGLRLRFERNENSKGKKFRFKKAKLEKGSVPTDFSKSTYELEQSVNGIKESIKTVEKTQTSFDERVNTVEKNAEGTTASVKKLQETQTAQGKTISEATSKIEQHSKALELQLKMKDVEDYVGGIGNQTVLRNVLWKNDTKYWQLTSNAARDTQVTYKGCNSLSVITTGNASNLYKGASHDYINAGPGWNYVFSAYFYTDNKASIDAGAAIELQCYDVNNKMIKSYLQEITISQGTWIRTHVAGLLIEGTKKVKVLFWVRKNGRLWMAQPMLQIGDKPSSFMENPVDIVDKDKIMEELADKIATKDYDKKVTELERSISATEKGVSIISGKQETFINETYNAYVKKTESKLEVLDEGILAQILKDGIVTAINMSPGQITINAAKLDINADTMVKWLTAKGIDTNLIKVNGDKITIDKNGVTIKMLDFLFEDEWGTKTTVMPKRNLIADHDFSSVPKLNIGNPNYQGFGAGYGLPWKVQGNGVVIENNTFIFNYEQMVNAVRVDTYNYPETKVQNGIHPGNSYTLSAHYRTAQINGVRTTAKPRLQVCFVTPLDEVSYKIWHEIYKDFPEPSTFYGEIRRYNFTFTVPNNYNPQEHMIVIKVTAANAQVSAGRAVCVSGITLVSGNYACMYNWDRAASERADGLQPFNRIAIGSVNNNIGPAAHGQTFDISTEKDVFVNQPILTQGINLGRNKMGQAGSIRFFDGGQGYGFYFMGMGGQWYKLPNV